MKPLGVKAVLLSLALLFAAGQGLAAKKKAVSTKVAIFAGGCFWCMQPPYQGLKGVSKVEVGYSGGKGLNPNYKDYIAKGHTEAVRIVYDPAQISYSALLDIFWRNINPTDKDGQFADRGPGYYAGIYWADEGQRKEAELSKAALDKSKRFDKPVLTPLHKAGAFYPAEEYHQDYARKNSLHYQMYKQGSGRAGFLEEKWGKP